MQDFRLKVFRTVAENLNFTHAAEVLFITQPAVTLQIKTLEEELGVKLFDRSGGKVRLTEAGEILLDYAERIAGLYSEAETAIGTLIGEQRGKLSLGASTSIAQYVLPHLIGKFLSLHPKIEFSMISANTENIVKALDAKSISLGLVEGPIGRSDLKFEPFIEDEIVVIAAANHELALNQSEKISLSDFAEMPLIMREYGSGTRHVIENALKKNGLKLSQLKIVMELDSTEAIKSVVEANLGIGLVSRWGLTRELELGTLKIIKIDQLEIKRQFQFVYPRTPRLDATAESFYRFARRHLPTQI
ncbi:MAG TPA: selenium metabolism-associated LysR family transcriptional regulator [Pyrinomonadaceae bacterium]|jgi:DNA-binding transcriptional LysR family regulator|nr:selenium metabolism-associated LysR family transcriptional regulator [Pyrinomonadaceae bacterium]